MSYLVLRNIYPININIKNIHKNIEQQQQQQNTKQKANKIPFRHRKLDLLWNKKRANKYQQQQQQHQNKLLIYIRLEVSSRIKED